jgi:ABC-type transport system involved in cytochrome c biogenesis permease subunit
MIWLLLRRDGAFRRLLRALSLACLLMLSLPISAIANSGYRGQVTGDSVQNSEFKIQNSDSNNQLSTVNYQLSIEEAAAFGRLSVYYRGRIAPFDSYARDYCKANFPKGKIPAGYNPVQLVTEIYLFPEKWPDQVRPAMKLFPQQEHWFAPDDDLNSADPADTLFIAHILDWLKLSIQESNQQQNTQIINSIYQFQEKRCTAGSIKRQREQIEIAYNQYKPESKIFLMEIIMAVVLLVLFLAVPNAKCTKTLALIFMFVALTFVLADIGLRCYLSGHSPFSGLFDTLMLLSAGVLFIGLFVSRKSSFITLPSLIASAFIILVATMMGGRSFSPLMPVLISPWLTIHVAILMTAYSMLTFTFILALISIPLIILKRKQELVQNITKISQVFCIIGVVLLATGIIIGSAWANISWGQYWSWDPKETWALITLIGYCAALPGVIPAANRHPWLYHLIILIAFCLLIMTYLGINLFGGMHAY